jgi:hypothetical protein
MLRVSQPLRRTLMATMLLTSAAAIVLACSARILAELITSRDESPFIDRSQDSQLGAIVAALKGRAVQD